MRKLYFERAKNAPSAKTDNLAPEIRGKGKFNSVTSTDKTEIKQSSMPNTKKELAAMRREKSKRDRQFFEGRLTTNYRGRIVE